jgi:hypothetical protein
MFRLVKMNKIVLHIIDDLANIDGSNDPNGLIPFGSTNTLYIETIA